MPGKRYKDCCHDCHRPYGDGGFPDLIIPYSAWKRISPNGDDSGLLCPSCICKRLDAKGIKCEGAFMSGPIISVSSATMNALRRVENIELAIEGRDNRWLEARRLTIEPAKPKRKRKDDSAEIKRATGAALLAINELAGNPQPKRRKKNVDDSRHDDGRRRI